MFDARNAAPDAARTRAWVEIDLDSVASDKDRLHAYST